MKLIERCDAQHRNTQAQQIGIYPCGGDHEGKSVLVVSSDDRSYPNESLILLDEGTIRWLTAELLNITNLPPEPIRGIHATEAETRADLDQDALDEYRADRACE